MIVKCKRCGYIFLPLQMGFKTCICRRVSVDWSKFGRHRVLNPEHAQQFDQETSEWVDF